MIQRETQLPESQKHYVEKEDYNRFIYHNKEQDAAGRTLIVIHDAEVLLALCERTFDDTSEYQLLIRLLKEQTIFHDDGTRRIRDKSEKEDASKALMNPADPEATFRRKAGGKHIGYVGNIVEAVGKKGSVVIDYAYEQNIYSDNQFLNDYLARQPIYEETATLVADGAYSGENNVNAASEHQIKLITTNFTSKKPADIFAEFKFDETGRTLLECGNHKKPIYTHYDEHNDRCNAHFSLADCQSCPCREPCNPSFRKSYALREVSWKTVNRAKQLRYMQTDEFKEYTHFRNGVEAVPSLLRRKYDVDKIPAHGKKQTGFYFGFKIAALNLQKLLDYTNGLKQCTPKEKAA